MSAHTQQSVSADRQDTDKAKILKFLKALPHTDFSDKGIENISKRFSISATELQALIRLMADNVDCRPMIEGVPIRIDSEVVGPASKVPELEQRQLQFRELPLTFEGRGETDGFTFLQLEASNSAYLYQVSDTFGNIWYEVFRKKENAQYGVISYPKQKSFGIWAWAPKRLEKAMLRFEELGKANLDDSGCKTLESEQVKIKKVRL